MAQCVKMAGTNRPHKERSMSANSTTAAPPPSTGMAAAITLAAIILIAGFIALGTGS